MQWTLLTALVIGIAGGAGLVLLAWTIRGRPNALATQWHGGMPERRSDAAVSVGAVEQVIDSAHIGMYFWNMKTDTLS